jgi:predicted DNA-binding transcriptional regulator AlpA
MTTPIPPGHLTRAQAADRLGLSLTWFDALVRKGQLTKHKNALTRAAWFLEAEVDQLAAKRATATDNAETAETGAGGA